jgi:hypothetical protein
VPLEKVESLLDPPKSHSGKQSAFSGSRERASHQELNQRSNQEERNNQHIDPPNVPHTFRWKAEPTIGLRVTPFPFGHEKGESDAYASAARQRIRDQLQEQYAKIIVSLMPMPQAVLMLTIDRDKPTDPSPIGSLRKRQCNRKPHNRGRDRAATEVACEFKERRTKWEGAV